MTAFRRLTLHFFRGYFRGDLYGVTDSGFDANIYAVFGLSATAELFFTGRGGPLFLAAWPVAFVAFVTAFEWDAMLPDRRDFLALAPFPLKLRQIMFAKMLSLLLFVGAVSIPVYAYAPFFLFGMAGGTVFNALAALAAQLASTALAALFGFLAVGCIQGIAMNLCTSGFYRRISPYLQIAVMCSAVFLIMMYPVYAASVGPLQGAHGSLARLLPPYWFWGIAATLGPVRSAVPGELAREAVAATATLLGLFLIVWTAGFARHYYGAMESAEPRPPHRAPRTAQTATAFFSRSERVLYAFSGQTLARSLRHRLFLATYLAIGLSLAILLALRIDGADIAFFAEGVRGATPLVVFFVVSGFRAVFQFPAELPASWIFRITESGWAAAVKRISRHRVLSSGLVPVVALAMPFEFWYWGPAIGLLHSLLQMTTGLVLIEVLFLSFDRIPFACSWFPGGLNLIFLAAAYLFGFTEYSFRIADLEALCERHLWPSIFVCVAAIAAWRLIRPRLPEARSHYPIRFDASRPLIESLKLLD